MRFLFVLMAFSAVLAQGAGNSQPKVIQRASPEYTQEATNARLEGVVVLRTVIDVEGRPTEIKVAKGLGKGLDEKAIECLTKWRFRPATQYGAAIPAKAAVEIRFRLPDALRN